MPYKPTGRPSGRPRKNPLSEDADLQAALKSSSPRIRRAARLAQKAEFTGEKQKTRLRAGYRAAADTALGSAPKVYDSTGRPRERKGPSRHQWVNN